MTSPKNKQPGQSENRQIFFLEKALEAEEVESSIGISSTIQKEKDEGSVNDSSRKEQSWIQNVENQEGVEDNSASQIDQNNLFGPFHQDIKTWVSSFLYLSDMYHRGESCIEDPETSHKEKDTVRGEEVSSDGWSE